MRKATPLLLVLAIVEISDVVFAVDSIPAVRHPADIRHLRVAHGCECKRCRPCLSFMDACMGLVALLHAWHGPRHHEFVMTGMVPGRTANTLQLTL